MEFLGKKRLTEYQTHGIRMCALYSSTLSQSSASDNQSDTGGLDDPQGHGSRRMAIMHLHGVREDSARGTL
ncbi:hypothetical protein CKO22_15475 [Thiococcus pfennigii]|nr:hypothetical protein [Thiococcus pfennigii]